MKPRTLSLHKYRLLELTIMKHSKWRKIEYTCIWATSTVSSRSGTLRPSSIRSESQKSNVSLRPRAHTILVDKRSWTAVPSRGNTGTPTSWNPRFFLHPSTLLWQAYSSERLRPIRMSSPASPQSTFKIAREFSLLLKTWKFAPGLQALTCGATSIRRRTEMTDCGNCQRIRRR